MNKDEFIRDINNRQRLMHFQRADFDKISCFNKGNFLSIESVRFIIIECKGKDESLKEIKNIINYMEDHINSPMSESTSRLIKEKYYMYCKLLKQLKDVEDF